jgi:hypothetical protein
MKNPFKRKPKEQEPNVGEVYDKVAAAGTIQEVLNLRSYIDKVTDPTIKLGNYILDRPNFL